MRLSLHFADPGFIAEPYHVERYKLIEIQKHSGMARARSEAKRNKALEEHLKSTGMTLNDYRALEQSASVPFFFTDAGLIYIPADRIASCLVNASAEAPAKMKIANIRSALRITDFVTDKKGADGTWERFAVVTNSAGKLSNQRGLRCSQYIRNFTAAGEISFDAAMVKPEGLVKLLEYAGRDIGIGASRKMGYGRFTVSSE